MLSNSVKSVAKEQGEKNNNKTPFSMVFLHIAPLLDSEAGVKCYVYPPKGGTILTISHGVY